MHFQSKAFAWAVIAWVYAASAQDTRPVPEQLFGLRLGSVHSLGIADRDIGTLPIKRFAGTQQFMGAGIHYYFQPQTDYKAFPYEERRKNNGDEYFETSYRLYLLPVFPPDALTRKSELKPTDMRWEIALIEWSGHEAKSSDAYFWARDFCKTLEVDLGMKPSIVDRYSENMFVCSFEQDARELEAKTIGGGGKYFALKYTSGAFQAKDEAADTMYRKLRMNSIRPY